MPSSDPSLIPPEVLRLTVGGYPMDPSGIHGLGHWGRVLENGLELCESTGANRLVVALFAVLHDCRRWSEGTDPGHGPRAAELVDDIGPALPGLSVFDADLLRTACAYHADGEVSSDPTVGTCWDADRLDLARVGIEPNVRLLCTDAARNPDQIDSSTRRAVRGFVPPYVAEWRTYRRATDQ